MRAVEGSALYKFIQGTGVGHKNCFEMYPFAKSKSPSPYLLKISKIKAAQDPRTFIMICKHTNPLR
jgi:hypothetical protein